MKNTFDENNQMRQLPTDVTAVKGKGLTAIFRIVFFLFLFLFSFEFLRKNFIWLYFAFVIGIGATRYFRLRPETLILAVLSLCLILFSGELPSVTAMLRVISFPLLYFVGTNLWVEKDESKLSIKKQESLISWSTFVFAIGTFLHFAINFVLNLGREDRNVIDFWSGEARSATNQAALGVLMLGFAIAVIFSNKGFWKKVLAAGVLALIAVYAMVLAGRTIFVLLLLVGAVAFLFMLFKNPNRSKTFWLTCLVFFAVLTLISMYMFNAFGLQDKVTSSNLYQRFFGEKMEVEWDETGRWASKGYFLEHFFESMWGGSYLKEGSGEYAHDILLDTHDQSGFFAFLAMAIFLLVSLYQIIRFVSDRRFSFNVRQLVLCLSIVFAVEFFLEPILQGMPWLFGMYCFLQGVIVNARQNADRIENYTYKKRLGLEKGR